MFLKVLKSKSKKTLKFIILDLLTQPLMFEGESGCREKEEDGDEEEESGGGGQKYKFLHFLKLEEEVKKYDFFIFIFVEFDRWVRGDGIQQKRSLEGALQGDHDGQ